MGYIGQQPTIGAYHVLDSITLSNGQSAYTMQLDGANFSPQSVNHMLVIINGVPQPASAYSINGHTLTLSSAATTGDVLNEIRVFGDVLNIGTPSDATVTNAKTNFVSTSSAAGLQIKGDGTTDGTLQLNCSQNSHGVKIASPNHSSGQSYTLTLPSTAPSNGKALITDGSGNLSFGSAGGLVLLSRQVVSSSTAEVVFNSSLITSTYDDYILKGSGIVPASDGPYHRWQTSTDNGSTMDTGWYSNGVIVRFDNNSVGSGSYTSNQNYLEIIDALGTASGETSSWVMWVNDVNSTTQKGWFAQKTQKSSNAYMYHHTQGFYRDSTGTINYLKYYLSSGNIASGTFTLYGLVKS